MKVSVCKLGGLSKDTWAVLENESDYLSVFQTLSWAEVLHSIGTEPFFFVLSENGNPLAGLLMSKSNFFWGALHTYEAMAGPLLRPGINDSTISLFASELKRAVKRMHGGSFYWIPSPHFESWQPFLSNGFLPIRAATFIVNLAPSLEVLWANLENRGRRTVKQAERSVNIEEARKWSDWMAFHDLYVKESTRAPLPPYSLRLHKSIYESLASKNGAKLFLARYQNRIVSGAIFLTTRSEMLGYRGASDYRYRRLSAVSAVHWHAIRWAKEHGIKYYDIGGALWEPEEKHFLYGVHMFKRQLGGTLHRYYGFALNRLYYTGRELIFRSSNIRRLYLSLEKLRVIQRTDRI